MSIAASGDGLMSSEDKGSGMPPSGVVATAAPDPELTAILSQAAVSIGLEVNRMPSPEPSRLDDWFLGVNGSTTIFLHPKVHGEKPLLGRSLLRPHYPRWRGCQGAGRESSHGAPLPSKHRHLEE